MVRIGNYYIDLHKEEMNNEILLCMHRAGMERR